MSQLKVMTILGTRPEIIRLSRVIAALDRHVEHVLVHTGQNHDYELNEIFFEDLEVRRPDHFLQVDTSSLGAALGNILIRSEEVLRAERPDAVLVLGDTNSALSAIMARRMKVPVYHMEAGNRSFDPNVPEEVNRRIVDHISDFNLVYTEHARRHLLSEGLPHRRIYLTGSPMREVLDHYRSRVEASQALATLELEPREYFLASLHREENVDNREHLRVLIDALNDLAETWGYPVIVSTHPRTRIRIEEASDLEVHGAIRFLKPFGFHDYNRLQMSAFCVVSDSGTVAEESAILGFPAVTPRNAIERPEALDAGGIIMTGLRADTIHAAVELVTAARDRPRALPMEYEITNTSERVLHLLVGTARVGHLWSGLRRHDHD